MIHIFEAAAERPSDQFDGTSTILPLQIGITVDRCRCHRADASQVVERATRNAFALCQLVGSRHGPRGLAGTGETQGAAAPQLQALPCVRAGDGQVPVLDSLEVAAEWLQRPYPLHVSVVQEPPRQEQLRLLLPDRLQRSDG